MHMRDRGKYESSSFHLTWVDACRIECAWYDWFPWPNISRVVSSVSPPWPNAPHNFYPRYTQIHWSQVLLHAQSPTEMRFLLNDWVARGRSSLCCSTMDELAASLVAWRWPCSSCMSGRNRNWWPRRYESQSVNAFAVSIAQLQLSHVDFLYWLTIHMFRHSTDVPIMRNTGL